MGKGGNDLQFDGRLHGTPEIKFISVAVRMWRKISIATYTRAQNVPVETAVVYIAAASLCRPMYDPYMPG